MENLIEVKNLKVYFKTETGTARAVDGISFSIEKGKTHALVGESGCGKTVTSLSLLGLIQKPAGYIEDGTIILNNGIKSINITELSEKELEKIRGKNITMIFQDPMTSLNPVFTIGNQLLEVISVHKKSLSKKDAVELVVSMLDKVGIPDPEKQLKSYPFQLSGGMLQRVMIAMSLICEPQLVIADEPTTALDVTIQAQILDLLGNIQKDRGISILFITHDLGVVAEIADTVSVMYAGKIVEHGTVEDIFKNAVHPYTKALFKSLPSLNMGKDRINSIKGIVPKATDYPDGCRFQDRCPYVIDKCRQAEPVLEKIKNQEAACFNTKAAENAI